MLALSVLGLGLVTTPLASRRRVCSQPTMMANWDPVRFATTAAFFNRPPSPAELLKRVAAAAQLLPPAQAGPDGLLWSADRPTLEPRLEWGPLDDVVMGGVSRSTFVNEGQYATFSGVVTSENNGGFAGCRSRALRWLAATRTCEPPISISRCG